jgi:predicted TIM-barrel fold metal-dependent hydrolase
MDRLTIVSMDGHAQMPPEAWPKYLDKRFHEFLPTLNQENSDFIGVSSHFFKRMHNADLYDVYDHEGAVRDGYGLGVWDHNIRMQEMDREGIAAEFIHSGDPRATGLFYQSSNRDHGMDRCNAGVKAYNRWLYDTFGSEPDRLYLIGILGSAPWRSVEELIEELDWIADHGFKATTLPGFTAYPGQPPLFDRYWDPFWARCEERGILLWMHAGQGERQGELGAMFHRIGETIREEQSDIPSAITKLSKQFFEGKVFASVKPRRAMWQLMMGGVFDRYPGLKLVLSEIYGDWMGRVFSYLDTQFEAHRDSLPAKRKPSDYWTTNCFNGLSFIRRCEVAMRHDLDISRLGFGRDYPHGEGTWPNTVEWLRDALGAVPREEAIGIMGQNAINALGLDGAKLDSIAARIGVPMDAIFGNHAPLSKDLIDHFHTRGQYLAEPEGDERMPEIDSMLQEDLWRAQAHA